MRGRRHYYCVERGWWWWWLEAGKICSKNLNFCWCSCCCCCLHVCLFLNSIVESGASLLPLALGAPEVPALHAVDFAALSRLAARPSDSRLGRDLQQAAARTHSDGPVHAHELVLRRRQERRMVRETHARDGDGWGEVLLLLQLPLVLRVLVRRSRHVQVRPGGHRRLRRHWAGAVKRETGHRSGRRHRRLTAVTAATAAADAAARPVDRVDGRRGETERRAWVMKLLHTGRAVDTDFLLNLCVVKLLLTGVDRVELPNMTFDGRILTIACITPRPRAGEDDPLLDWWWLCLLLLMLQLVARADAAATAADC